MTIIEIKVNPGSKQSQIEGWEGQWLKVRIKAAPEEGKANEALIELLSDILGIAKRRITILQGHKSRYKRVALEDFSTEELHARII